MAEIQLTKEIIDFINTPGNIKALASISKDGELHVVYKGSLKATDDGFLVYDEVIENSQTNKNVLNSLWFNKEVAINILSPDKRSIQIKGIPVKSLVHGAVFEEHYRAIQERSKDNDLGAVYFIKPTKIIEESFNIQKEYYEKDEPLYIHLDRFTD